MTSVIENSVPISGLAKAGMLQSQANIQVSNELLDSEVFPAKTEDVLKTAPKLTIIAIGYMVDGPEKNSFFAISL